MSKRSLLVLAPVYLSACFNTTYDLLSAGDDRRELIGGSAPSNWTAQSFDDSAWHATRAGTEPMAPMADGTMPTVCIRQRFDLGPNPATYNKLTLSLHIDGVYDAYVNGVAMTGNGDQRTYVPASGALQPAENVLAIAIHPNRTMQQLAISTKLDSTQHTLALPQINKGPYLLLPTPDGITIAWETSVPAPSSAVVAGRVIDGGNKIYHLAKVTGLEPGKSYRYHVEVGDLHSDEANLQTAPAPGQRLRFAVFGDNRTDGNTHRQLVESLIAEAPDFILNTGDMVGESTADEWQKFFDIEYQLLIQTPIYPALGNHEHDYGTAALFAHYFPLDASGRHGSVYSSDFGDAHMAVIDTNSDLDWQASWLDADLTAAEARGAQATFVIMHWGPWCGTDDIGHGSNDDVSESIVPVVRRHKVAALLSGHNHVYERGASRGLPYIVSGGGGAPLMDAGRVGETLFSRSINHYVIVDVLGSSVHITAKDESGFAFDEAQLSQ
jgi:hypothetical protein